MRDDMELKQGLLNARILLCREASRRRFKMSIRTGPLKPVLFSKICLDEALQLSANRDKKCSVTAGGGGRAVCHRLAGEERLGWANALYIPSPECYGTYGTEGISTSMSRKNILDDS